MEILLNVIDSASMFLSTRALLNFRSNYISSIGLFNYLFTKVTTFIRDQRGWNFVLVLGDFWITTVAMIGIHMLVVEACVNRVVGSFGKELALTLSGDEKNRKNSSGEKCNQSIPSQCIFTILYMLTLWQYVHECPLGLRVFNKANLGCLLVVIHVIIWNFIHSFAHGWWKL